MGQSNYIAAALTLAFVIYITARGSLPKYLSILTGSGGSSGDNAVVPKETGETSETPKEDDKKGDTVIGNSLLNLTIKKGGVADSILGGVKTTQDILKSVTGEGL